MSGRLAAARTVQYCECRSPSRTPKRTSLDIEEPLANKISAMLDVPRSQSPMDHGLDGLVAHRAAGTASGRSPAEATVGGTGRGGGWIGRGGSVARGRQTHALPWGASDVEAPVGCGLVPWFVVRREQASPRNAEGLPEALAPDGDLRPSRADANARPGLRDVYGHAGGYPDPPPETKSPCHLGNSMCAVIACNNNSRIMAGPAPGAGADRPSSGHGRGSCQPNP